MEGLLPRLLLTWLLMAVGAALGGMLGQAVKLPGLGAALGAAVGAALPLLPLYGRHTIRRLTGKSITPSPFHLSSS